MSPPSNSSANLYDYGYEFNHTLAMVVLVSSGAFLVIGLIAFYLNKCFFPHSEIDPQAFDPRIGEKNSGLDVKIIETFPVVAYSAALMAKNCTDCAVCLTEFEEEEEARVLPNCRHVFHPECIDMWLFSHSTCPLCRLNLLSESHTITIHYCTPPEDSPPAPQVIESDAEASSAENSSSIAEVERTEETPTTVLALSRSCQRLQEAAEQVQIRERSAGKSFDSTMEDIGISSRWRSKSKRSCSMEVLGSSPKVDDPEVYADSVTQVKEATTDASSSGSERIAKIATPVDQGEVICCNLGSHQRTED